MYNGKYANHPARKRRGSKRAGMVLLSLLLALTATIGGTLAYLMTETTAIKNTFTPSEVTVEVTEDFTDGVNKKSVNVVNTGNIDAWVRIKLVSYWVSADGTKILGGTAEIPDFTPGTGWVFREDADTGIGYYYYTSPVAPRDDENDITGMPDTDLISSITLQVKTETDDAGNTVITEKQVIEVIAEAVQSKPDQAVIDAWGFVPGK